MLVTITTRCHEGCSHCMIDARPDGQDMTLETFQDAIVFMIAVGPRIIQISGGEPTLHPMFVEFVELTTQMFPNTLVLIESNGSFITDKETTKKVHAVLKIKNVHLQVRTHPDYYPNYKRTINSAELRSLPKTGVFSDSIAIFPIGRAKNMPAGKKYRTCANLFLLHKQRPSYIVPMLAKVLQENNKFCSPMIDTNGILHAGESTYCTELGHVSNPKSMYDVAPCGKCGLQGGVL